MHLSNRQLSTRTHFLFTCMYTYICTYIYIHRYSQSHLGWHFRQLKAQSSHDSVKRAIRPLSFELWNSIRKFHPKWDWLYIHTYTCATVAHTVVDSYPHFLYTCMYTHICTYSYIYTDTYTYTGTCKYIHKHRHLSCEQFSFRIHSPSTCMYAYTHTYT